MPPVSELIQFALLGLGIGGAYALLSVGVVAIYRGTSVPNFAQGAVAMITAYLFFGLRDDHQLPAWLAMLLALGVGGAIGGGFYFLVMRQIRHSPVLAKLVATLALVTLLQGVALLAFNVQTKTPQSVLPAQLVHLLGFTLVTDRIELAAVAVLAAVGVWLWSRYTRAGLATRALADSEKGVQLLGFSPDALAAITWIIGSMLAALAGILVSPIAGLDATALTLLVVPVFSAALIARFSSFGVVVIAAFAIGSGQSILQLFSQPGPWYTFLWEGPGRSDTFPALLIIVAMVASGRLLPQRGFLSAGRMPLSARPRHLLLSVGLGLAVTLPMILLLPRSWVAALTTSLLGAVIALSLVAVSGYVGQISLAQVAFAGVGALVAGRLAAGSVPFPVPVLAAAGASTVIGIAVGLPALRVRGPSLAIVTLCAALILDKLVFENAAFVGSGYVRVPAPSFLGHDLGYRTYAVVVLGVLVSLAVALARIRGSRTGRRFLAVRENEAAATAAGVNVAATKLLAFSLSAFVAGCAGGLIAYDQRVFAYENFTISQSLLLLILTYIGGIGMIAGAVIAGVAVSGGFFAKLLTEVGLDRFHAIIAGAGLLIAIQVHPDGLASLPEAVRRRLRRPAAPLRKLSEGSTSHPEKVAASHEAGG